MQEQMSIILSAIDNASSIFESVSNTAKDLENNLKGIGDEADEMDQLGDGAEKAEGDIKKLGDESENTKKEVDDLGNKSQSAGVTMQTAFQNIADGVTRAKQGVVELGKNLMETLSLAGQQEQQETFLKMNIGAEGAAKQMKVINDLVADLPGDDVAIGGLLSQAAAKNASITADELQRMGTNAADYFAAMSNYGKSSVEAQQDLTNYILTGNTAELERSPILQGHIDKLKEASTVEERNKALQEAMAEEGWANISQQDTYNNKLETFTAMLDRGKRQLGDLFLGVAGGAMDFIGQIDAATGGVLGMGFAIGTVAGGPIIDLVTGAGQMATGLSALRTAFEGTAIATAIAEQGFWATAAAELAAAWPILAIVAAIALLVAAVYEIGKAFGWWTDVGSMIDAISAGLQRLWSAFINNPDVQAFLQAMSEAFGVLWEMVQQAGQAVLEFFGISNNGEFDIVRALIDGVGIAFNNIKTILQPVITLVMGVINAFNQFRTGQIDLPTFIWNVLTLLAQAYTTIFSRIIGFVARFASQMIQRGISAATNFVNNIITRIRQLPGRIYSALMNVVSRIRSAIQSWITTASSKVSSLISSITSPFSGVASAISGALSGVVSAITAPFQAAWDAIEPIVSKIQEGMELIGARGGEESEGRQSLLIGANDTSSKVTTTPVVTTTPDDHLTVDINNNVTLDLVNVPQHIDTDTLIQGLSDRKVLSALTSNSDFQTLDAKVKERLNLKIARSRGV